MKRALSYPLKLIAKNAGVNGSVVSEKVCVYLPLNALCMHTLVQKIVCVCV